MGSAMVTRRRKRHMGAIFILRNPYLFHIHYITDFPTRCVKAVCLKCRPFSPLLVHFR